MNKKIDIKRFLEKFNQEYEFLYDNRDNVAGVNEAISAFDEFLMSNREFVIEFVNFRGDVVSSDREAAAFMFAMESIVQTSHGWE